MRLPGVGFWGRSAGTGKDVVELVQGFLGEVDIKGMQVAVELAQGTRSDDGSGDDRVREQPGQGNMSWLFPSSAQNFS